MKTTDTGPRRLRRKSGGARRDSVANRNRDRPRSGPSAPSSGRGRRDASDWENGAEPARPTSGNRRERRREVDAQSDQLVDDFLVEQEERGEIGHNSRNAAEEVELLPLERETAGPTSVQLRLLDPSKKMVRQYVRLAVKPELTRLAGASTEALYAALDKIYEVGLAIYQADPVRRIMLMGMLGCHPGNKKVFLALIHSFWPLPSKYSADKAARKRVSNRLSEYSRALEGARLKGVAPGQLAEKLARGGGIEEFADHARKEEAGENIPGRAAALNGRGTSRQPVRQRPGPTRQDNASDRGRSRGSRPMGGYRGLSAQEANVATEAGETEPASGNGTAHKAPLWMGPDLAERLKKQTGEVVAIIDVKRATTLPLLELIGFQHLPRHKFDSIEKLLDEMIDSILG